MTRILVVEDSRTQAEALRADLEAAGFAVQLSHTAPAALRVLRAEEFDLIVSDVVMPGMDGYELCRRVKENPQTRHLPVILLTTLADPLDVVNGLESGADNFIRKPYQAEQLVARLDTALQNRQLRQTEAAKTGVRLSFLDREFHITAERQQILDLLISTFEELVLASREIYAREEELARAYAELERHLHTTELERARLQAVVGAVPVPLFVTGPDGRITHASGTTARAFGIAADQVGDITPDELAQFVDADGAGIDRDALPHRRAVREGTAITMGSSFDVFLARADGTRLPVLLHASPVLDDRGQPAGSVATAQVLGALTEHDPLTGLPNRRAFLDRAAGVFAGHRGGGSALLLVQLDRIDVAMTSLGNTTDDALVLETARRLRQIFEPTPDNIAVPECLLAHLGGGKFGVLLAGLPNQFGLVRLADAASRRVSDEPYACSDIPLTASVGVSVADVGQQAPQMLAGASAALRRAQSAGGDRVELYGPDASQEAMRHLQIEADLRSAVERGEITLHYQPEVDLVTGRVVGFEALARWHHETLGPVRPDVFVSLAEESTLILALGRHVLAEACRQARAWQELLDEEQPLTMAVNISAVQLRQEFVGEVVEVLEQTDLDPTRLMVEVTETAAMNDPETTVSVLDKLRELGVRCALDDFGAGYSSLAYLSRIRFDLLKLDRAFVADLGGGSHAGPAVAKSIIALGHSLGVPVLAEGVEEPHQADALRMLGCDQAQGFLFSEPLAAQDATVYLSHARGEGIRASAPSRRH